MYVRTVKEQNLNFRVSGKLWMRSLVMSDVETSSEWSHLLGKAMAGELKGASLKPIVSDMLTWGAWLKLHPDTTVMNLPRTAREFNDSFYRSPDRFVCGFIANGKPHALPFRLLTKNPVHSFEAEGIAMVSVFNKKSTAVRIFDARVDGKSLTFAELEAETMKDAQTQTVWDRQTGKAIDGPMKGKQLEQEVGIMSFRRAWMNFHPESRDVQ